MHSKTDRVSLRKEPKQQFRVGVQRTVAKNSGKEQWQR